jgi:hypothetical protein
LVLDNSIHGLNHGRFRPDSGLPDHSDFYCFSEKTAAIDTLDSNSGDFCPALRKSADQSCLCQADQSVPYGLATNAKRDPFDLNRMRPPLIPLTIWIAILSASVG